MRLRIEIDDELLQAAMRLGGHETPRPAIEAALRLLIQSAGTEGRRRGSERNAGAAGTADSFLRTRAGQAPPEDLLNFTQKAPVGDSRQD